MMAMPMSRSFWYSRSVRVKTCLLYTSLKPGMALVIRYEGPKGGPGMQEMLYPTSFVKGKGFGKQVAMLLSLIHI